jgi:NAD(P)-dependent dehydrogenase (short-subunit alcohol dehydrogenase family)
MGASDTMDPSAACSLRRKVALITGVARGMGAEHARTFITAGARVVLTDVLDAEGLRIAEELGENAAYLHLDVANPEARASVTSRVAEEIGPITVLVNNAGVPGPWAGVATMEVDDYLRVIQVDQHGTFFGMRAVIPGMIQADGGSIVNISSVAGYGPPRVRANAVCPGGTPTPTYAGVRQDARGKDECDRAASTTSSTAASLRASASQTATTLKYSLKVPLRICDHITSTAVPRVDVVSQFRWRG